MIGQYRTFELPYGRGEMALTLDASRISGVLISGVDRYVPDRDQSELVSKALEEPINSPRLRELARGKRKIVLITSDHTRPVPSRITLPKMLRELRQGSPEAEIVILVATGCHRGMTESEKRDRFGEEIVKREHIIVHDCDDPGMTDLGTLPSGSRLIINRIAAEADLLVAEGFIEPHFFAGFSGGRKAVLPGISSRETVLENHCAAKIDSPHARTGILLNNPIHTDMLWAARRAGLLFILNVVLNGKKQIINAFAGDTEAAHKAGCDFLSGLCRVTGKPSDIVVTSNGGYPLDQNLYQAVKGMTAAEALVRRGGVIIMAAQASDGVGGEHFYHQMADEGGIDKTLTLFRARSASETAPDQWQSQICFRVLKKASVVLVSDIDDAIVRSMHMIPCHDLTTAMSVAEALLGNPKSSVTVIPDGVSVIAEAG